MNYFSFHNLWSNSVQVSLFYADPKSKMAATAGHRLTLDPMGKCSSMNIMRYGVNVNETTNVKLSPAVATILDFISEQKT
jgi:hypothetical protein